VHYLGYQMLLASFPGPAQLSITRESLEDVLGLPILTNWSYIPPKPALFTKWFIKCVSVPIDVIWWHYLLGLPSTIWE